MKKHLKYKGSPRVAGLPRERPQIIDSNMSENDDENEEELTFEQKMDLHNKYCRLVYKLWSLNSHKETIETTSKYFGESVKNDDYYKTIDDIKKYEKEIKSIEKTLIKIKYISGDRLDTLPLSII